MKCKDCTFCTQIDWGTYICSEYDELGALNRKDMNKECKGKRLKMKANGRKPIKRKSITEESWGML